MTNTCAIIRSVSVDDCAIRLFHELAPVFGDNIYFFVERYRDETIEILMRGKTIFAGGGFLKKKGLPNFNKLGWQCGDFAYYGALEFLGKYDYFLLVEDDVSLRYSSTSFFNRLLSSTADYLVADFREANGSWRWAKSIQGFKSGSVYYGLFPVTRISKRAASHLLNERARYSASFRLDGIDLNNNHTSYANDEAFTATVLMNDGFDCRDLKELFDSKAFDQFSLFSAIHPGELPMLNNKIIHPVCSGQKARTKYGHLMVDLDKNYDTLKRRYMEYCTALDGWENFSGINPDLFDPEKDEPLINMAILLKRIECIIKKSDNRLAKSWLYESRIAVFDFVCDSESIAYDVIFSEIIKSYRVLLFSRNTGGRLLYGKFKDREREGSKIPIGSIPSDLDVTVIANSIAEIIVDSLSEIDGTDSYQ